MEQIIGQLIEARKKANLSLQDIQQKTKIPLRQLEYLEAYQFDKIGASVYVKGFVRRYAQEVGIDPSMLWEQEDNSLDSPPPRTRRRKQPVRFNLAPLFRIGTIIALVVIVGILIRTAIITYMEPPPLDPPEIPPGNEEPAPGDDNGQQEPIPEPEPEVQLELVESDDNGAVYVVRNAETLDITAEFIGPCWLRISADGQRLEEGTFQPGQEAEWTGAQVFELRVGAPRQATITVNGIVIDLPDINRAFNLEISIEEIQ